MVLPTPLGPSRIRLRPSLTKSSKRARSIRPRSIFLGQLQSKSAIGLKEPMRLAESRRSSDLRARRADSRRTSSSRRSRGETRRSPARASRSSREAAVAWSPRADRRLARSFIFALLITGGGWNGELVVVVQRVRTDMQDSQIWPLAEIDGQGRDTPCEATL